MRMVMPSTLATVAAMLLAIAAMASHEAPRSGGPLAAALAWVDTGEIAPCPSAVAARKEPGHDRPALDECWGGRVALARRARVMVHHTSMPPPARA